MSADMTLQRGMKSVGFAGPVAFLLVLWAASLGGRFDWAVFSIAFGALALCWARTWVLVPIHERRIAQETAEWARYGQQDWHLLEVFSSLSGAEIDRLRADVAQARSEPVRALLMEKAPHWDDEDRRRFLEYFIDVLSEISTVYIDSDATIRTYD